MLINGLGGKFSISQSGEDFIISQSSPSNLFWVTDPVVVTREEMNQMQPALNIINGCSEAPSELANLDKDECFPVIQMIDRVFHEAINKYKDRLVSDDNWDRKYKDLANFFRERNKLNAGVVLNLALAVMTGEFLGRFPVGDISEIFLSKKTSGSEWIRECSGSRRVALIYIAEEETRRINHTKDIILSRAYTLINDIEELKIFIEPSTTIIKELQRLVLVFNRISPFERLPIIDSTNVESSLSGLGKIVNSKVHEKKWHIYRFVNEDLEKLRADERLTRANRFSQLAQENKDLQADLEATQVQLETLQEQNNEVQDKNEGLEGELDLHKLIQYFNGVRYELKVRIVNPTSSQLASMKQIDNAINDVLQKLADNGDPNDLIKALEVLRNNLNAYPTTDKVIQAAIDKINEIFEGAE